jgi:hypothetical protein
MGRYKNSFKLPYFVPVFTATLDQPAWRAMSHGAQMLYIALKRHWSPQRGNNGSIFLSQRQAAQHLKSHHNQIARWYRELQHFGFIVMSTPGCLGVEGMGKAPRWRLTELPTASEPPTRDYENWDGQPFVDKKKSRAGKSARGVREKQQPGVRENRASEMSSVAESAHKATPRQRAVNHSQNYSAISTDQVSASVCLPTLEVNTDG